MPYRQPKLRTASKIKPPYPLGQFPRDFVLRIGADIIYHLATNPSPNLEGSEWERIFARAIDAKWKPSNIGLDDITLGVCAWGAKSVKHSSPHRAQTVRIISGRNSPAYSFGQTELGAKAQLIGTQVLDIWNARVESIREKFSHVRTVVLIKSADLTEFTVFETETLRYPPDRYLWARNMRGNLEGTDSNTGKHQFTWQPHGSQFTIIESVPESRICFRIKRPDLIDRDATLNAIGVEPSWVQIISP